MCEFKSWTRSATATGSAEFYGFNCFNFVENRRTGEKQHFGKCNARPAMMFTLISSFGHTMLEER